MKKSVLFLFFIATVLYANSQLSFKNSRSRPVYISIAYKINSDGYEGYYSSGWYQIDPGETKIVLSGDLVNQYYYYTAKEKGTNSVWEGNGDYKFCVDPVQPFKIKNADKQFVKEDNPNYNWGNFKLIDVGDKREHTVELIESNTSQSSGGNFDGKYSGGESTYVSVSTIDNQSISIELCFSRGSCAMDCYVGTLSKGGTATFSGMVHPSSDADDKHQLTIKLSEKIASVSSSETSESWGLGSSCDPFGDYKK